MSHPVTGWQYITKVIQIGLPSFIINSCPGPGYSAPGQEDRLSNLPKLHISSRGTRSTRVIYPSEWIDHRDYDVSLLSIYSRGNRDDILKTDKLQPSEKGEFLRFYDSLYLWDNFVPKVKPPFSAEYYWINSISRGPEFAEYLKDYFAYSIRESMGIDFQNPGPPVEASQGYNDLFPYQGLLKFREKVEDYLYSMIETSKPLDDDLEELEDVMRDMIKDIPDIELISELEILSEESTSSSYLEKEDRTKPFCLVNDNSFSREMVGRRAVVPVYPAGTRDTVVLTKSSANSVKLLERQTRHILEHIKESAVCLRGSTYFRRLRRIQSKPVNCVHYLRDIKKCGHTFPIQNLVDSFIKVMNERFPHRFWQRYQIFKRRRVMGYSPKGWSYPNRGYFLGMANHLTTFMLIAIYRLSVKWFKEDYPEASIKFEAILGNDDSDIVLCPKGELKWNVHEVAAYAKLFADSHTNTMSSFGVWVNSKKSFISRDSIFYEEYTKPGFQLKESRYAITLANCLSLPNIRMSKHMFKSFLVSCPTLNLECLGPMIEYVSDILGFEFDKHEGKRDYYLGGWIPKRTNSLSDVLYDLELQEMNPGRLSQIFNYVLRVERLNVSTPVEVTSPELNARPIAKAMLISGKPPPHLASVVTTRASLEKFYSKLIDFERKPYGYVSLIEGLRKRCFKSLTKVSFYSLVTQVTGEIDCNIPPSLVKTYTNEGVCVNPAWSGYSELEVPNRLIKSLSYETKGSLKSDLDIPVRDCWEYLNLAGKMNITDQTTEYPFVPVTIGELQKVCSDGLTSLMNHSIKYGRIIKEVLFDLPDRKIPIWRVDASFRDLWLQIPRSIEEIEDEISPYTGDLSFLGSEKIVAIEPLPPEEELEEIAENDYTPPEEPFDSKPVEKLLSLDASTIEFLFQHPKFLFMFVHNPCEEHEEYTEKPLYPKLDCLICQAYVWEQSSERMDGSPLSPEEYESLISAEKLLKEVGLYRSAPDPFEDGSDDEGGALGLLG